MSEILNSSDQEPTIPIGEGENFSFTTIANFDDHISREIRGYMELDRMVKAIGNFAMEDETNVFDIGASTGRFIKELDAELKQEDDTARQKKVDFFGIEPNSNFHADFPNTENIHLMTQGIGSGTEFPNSSFISSVFTLQFVPAKDRQAILDNVYSGLNPNGVFVWAEKVFSTDSQIEQILTSIHLDFKREGSSSETIMDKERRLRPIMRPFPLEKNIRMLEEAGFSQIDTFWRVNNFVGIIAVK